MRTLSENNFSELFNQLIGFPCCEVSKPRPTKKAPTFVIHIDVKRSSRTFKIFKNILSSFKNLKVQTDPFFNLSELEWAQKGDVLTVGFTISGHKVDIELIPKGFLKDYDVYVSNSVKEYYLSEDLIDITVELKKLDDSKAPKSVRGYRQLESSDSVPYVRKHSDFVTIGYSRYAIQTDMFGNEYIVINQERFEV